MKRIIGIFAFALALLAVSCSKEDAMNGPINEIGDLYTVPAEASKVTLTASNSTWSTDRRYFDLTFGSALSTRLVGYDALLTPGQYLLGADEIGKAVLANTTLNGKAVKQGFITVGNRDGQYMITAQIDGEVLAWTGTLPFVEDPAPLTLSVVQSTSVNKDNHLVTMQLATEGISQEFDMTTYQNVWKGEGKYIAIDLYSQDGYLHDGDYTASSEGGVVNAGEFGIGYDTTVDWGFGPMEMKDWGTCLWTVSDGAATAEKITSGLIKVTSREEKVDDKDVTVWTISWGVNYPVEILFEGAIPALTKPKKPSGPVSPDYVYTIGEPVDCSTSSGEVVSGVKKYPITIADAGGEEVAYLEFVLAEGSDDVVAGEYVSTEYAHEVGTLANGYFMDFGDWGTFAGGSYYISGGEKVYIDPGVTVIVTQIGTGAFSFTSTGFDFAAAGPNYVPGGGVETDHTYEIGAPADCSTSSGEVVSGVKKYPFTIKNAGGEEVAYLEFVLAEGSDDVVAGDYVSTEYAHEVGTLANGYFMDFGDWGTFSGGSYYISGGEKVYIDPGVTVTVTQLGPGAFRFTSDGFDFAASRAN